MATSEMPLALTTEAYHSCSPLSRGLGDLILAGWFTAGIARMGAALPGSAKLARELVRTATEAGYDASMAARRGIPAATGAEGLRA